MKRRTTFEEYEKDNQMWRQLMWVMAVSATLLLLLSFIIPISLMASMVTFAMLFIYRDEPERLKQHYRLSAKKECVEIDSFELQEFERKGKIGKVFKDTHETKVEFIYIDGFGKINHKQFSSFDLDFKLLNCFDEEKIVVKEEQYVDERFTKALGKASRIPKYEIYVDIDNLKLIG